MFDHFSGLTLKGLRSCSGLLHLKKSYFKYLLALSSKSIKANKVTRKFRKTSSNILFSDVILHLWNEHCKTILDFLLKVYHIGFFFIQTFLQFVKSAWQVFKYGIFWFVFFFNYGNLLCISEQIPKNMTRQTSYLDSFHKVDCLQRNIPSACSISCITTPFCSHP